MIANVMPVRELDEVKLLLATCELPTADIAEDSAILFFGIRSADRMLAGVVGLETVESAALLRSLAVAPAERNRGIATALVSFAERYARQHGLEALYLLTNTAAAFFRRVGYVDIARDAAPASIRMTAQFTTLCSANAASLYLPLRSQTA